MMETNDSKVFSESLNIYRENEMNYNSSEENIENNLIIRSDDFFSDFPSLNSHNSSLVYESIESMENEDNKENEDLMNRSNDMQNINQFCVNNCEQIIKRLIADNEELKKFKRQLIVIEEQNVELIREKERLELELKQIKESFERKIILKNQSIEDLKKSLYIFESLNSSLQKELELKRCEKLKLEAHISEVEDKLYFSEMQLIECHKSEEELIISYQSVKQAFTEEEDNKYKTVEQLHSVYVECAQKQNEIQELNQQISDLSREIADRDNELWSFKMKFDESFYNSINKSDIHSIDSKRESVYVNRTDSEVPEYSFSVNEDDSEYIYHDFKDDITPRSSEDSNDFESISESFNKQSSSQTVVTEDKPFDTHLFFRFINLMMFLFFKLPFKSILTVFLVILSVKLLLGSILATRLPAYTSWEEIIYRVLLPYLSKVKVSQTQ